MNLCTQPISQSRLKATSMRADVSFIPLPTHPPLVLLVLLSLCHLMLSHPIHIARYPSYHTHYIRGTGKNVRQNGVETPKKYVYIFASNSLHE
jgi:hypothetical protein